MMVNCWVLFSHGKRYLEQGLWCNENVGKHRHFSKEDIREASIENCLQDKILSQDSLFVQGPLGSVCLQHHPREKNPCPRCTVLQTSSPTLNVQKHRPHPTPIMHGAGNARNPHILYASQEKRELREPGGEPFTTRFIALMNKRGDLLEIRGRKLLNSRAAALQALCLSRGSRTFPKPSAVPPNTPPPHRFFQPPPHRLSQEGLQPGAGSMWRMKDSGILATGKENAHRLQEGTMS